MASPTSASSRGRGELSPGHVGLWASAPSSRQQTRQPTKRDPSRQVGTVAELLADEAPPAEVLDELDAHVEALGELSWELGPGLAEPNALVITPDGNPELLPVARRTISFAPCLSGWEFYPARPPKQWTLHGATWLMVNSGKRRV